MTKQQDKVIKGLECCIKRDPDDNPRCAECPYDSACLNRLKNDALELLKAQQPRVMTAEQLEDWLEPVYLEDIFSGARWALIADFSANWFTFRVTEPGFLKEEEFHATEYGRRWRCWTSRPDEKRRAETPWE